MSSVIFRNHCHYTTIGKLTRSQIFYNERNLIHLVHFARKSRRSIGLRTEGMIHRGECSEKPDTIRENAPQNIQKVPYAAVDKKVATRYAKTDMELAVRIAATPHTRIDCLPTKVGSTHSSLSAIGDSIATRHTHGTARAKTGNCPHTQPETCKWLVISEHRSEIGLTRTCSAFG